MKNKLSVICKCIISYIATIFILNILVGLFIIYFKTIPQSFEYTLKGTIVGLIGFNITKFFSILISMRLIAKKRTSLVIMHYLVFIQL